MSSISSILCGEYPAIRNLLSRVYFRNFCDRMAMTLLPRFLDCVARCKRVNEMSAQQMLLDLHSLKTLFLQLPTVQQNETDEMKYVIPPTLGRGGGVMRRYTKFVNKAVDKADMMLKLLGTPVAYLASSMHNM